MPLEPVTTAGDYVVGLLVLVIFLIGAFALVTRRMPALITLPLMAVGIAGGTAIITHLPFYHGATIAFSDILNQVLPQGIVFLSKAILIAFLGGMLSFIMQKSGVAHSLVKQGAELIGDNPLAVALFSLTIIALLFTTIAGLGAVIMVALVVLPMLATVGVPPAVAGGILLIGLSMGGIMNPQAWALYVETLKVPVETIRSYALTVFFLLGYTGIVFICVELIRCGAVRRYRQPAMLLIGGGIIIGAIIVYLTLAEGAGAAANPLAGTAKRVLQILCGGALLICFVSALADLFVRVRYWRHQVVKIKWFAYVIPIVPLVLIILFEVDIIAAFLAGFVYAVVVTARPGSVSLTVQSMIQGANSVMPAVILMLGIGVLLVSVLGPSGWSAAHDGAQWPVLGAIQPLFKKILPEGPILYVVVFSICAPLALYRGPLNTWGLGFGVANIMIATGNLSAGSIMAMLMTVGQVQGICDPTNTHNVWLANELRVDVNGLMLKTLPYAWGMVIVGLIIASFRFF